MQQAAAQAYRAVRRGRLRRRKAYSVALHHKLNRPAVLQESLVVADRENGLPGQFLEQPALFFSEFAGQVHDMTAFRLVGRLHADRLHRPRLAPSLPGEIVQHGAKGAFAPHADDDGAVRALESRVRPSREEGEVEEERRLQGVLRRKGRRGGRRGRAEQGRRDERPRHDPPPSGQARGHRKAPRAEMSCAETTRRASSKSRGLVR